MTVTYYLNRVGDVFKKTTNNDGSQVDQMISSEPPNQDWTDYQAWLAAGNIPDQLPA